MISIIIATYNGAPTLVRTLDAIAHITAPDAGYEVIVVDNASTDNSQQIIRSFEDRLPLTYIHEERRGKAFALNSGIDSAKGDFLVFADDDILPDADWLRGYEGSAAAHPDQSFFAGQVRHHWDVPPPHWLERLGASGMSYAGTPEAREAGPVSYLAAKGPNMAVRKKALGAVRFRTEEGINYMGTGTGTGGVDSWFARDASDGTIWYAPDASVKHIVRDHQIGIKPVFKRYVRIGLTNYYAERDTDTLFKRRVLGLPVTVLGRLARSGAGGVYRLMRGDTEAAARRMLEFAMDWGRLKSWRTARNSVGKQP